MGSSQSTPHVRTPSTTRTQAKRSVGFNSHARYGQNIDGAEHCEFTGMILSPWSNCLREGGSSQACKCRRLVEAVQKPIAADEPIGRQVRRCSVFSRVADHLGDAKCIPLFLELWPNPLAPWPRYTVPNLRLCDGFYMYTVNFTQKNTRQSKFSLILFDFHTEVSE
jgi:hypothetical protein